MFFRYLSTLGLCFLALLACSPRKNEPQKISPIKFLKPSERLEDELGVGEVHTFEVGLEAGQVLDVVVDQLGVDLVVTLRDPRDPQGEALLVVDNPSGANGAAGPERVFWVGEATMNYRLTLKGFSAQAGRYEILLEEPRPATESDRLRATAERRMHTGDLLYRPTERESLKRSIDEYEVALKTFRDLSDSSREADALYRLGRSFEGLGEGAQALGVYNQALALYEKTEHERQQAITLHNLCNSHRSLYELEKARDHCFRALSLWEGVGDHVGRAKSSNVLGLIYQQRGEGQQAQAFYQQALRLCRRLEDRSMEATFLHNRGRFYASLGRSEQAREDLSRALEIREELGERLQIVITLNSLATAHIRWGEMERALEYSRAALELHKPGDDRRRAITWSEMARIYARSGKDSEALDYYEQAEKIFRDGGDSAWEAQTLKSIGKVLLARNQTQEALEYFRRASERFEESQDRTGVGASLLEIARTERHRGNLKTARAHIEAALSIVEDLRIRMAASGNQRASYFATKQRYYEFYIDLLMELHDKFPQASHNHEALAASERSRARSLLEMLPEGGRELEHRVDPAQLAHKQDLEQRINKLSGWLKPSVADRQEVSRIESAQRDLLREYELVQGEIRLKNPHYATLAQPTLSKAGEFQQLLDEESLFLLFQLGKERSFLWAVTSDEVKSFVLPPRAEIEDVAEKTYDLISRNTSKSALRIQMYLAKLSTWLLDPVAAQLQGKKRLVIVSDGALRYLPFSALPVPGTSHRDPDSTVPLVTGHEIVYLPSASTLAVLRRRLLDHQSAPKTLAVLADPVFSTRDPRFTTLRGAKQDPFDESSGFLASYRRLPHAEFEAESILSLVPAENRFAALGFTAHRQLVESGTLSDYRIVHFATHGQLNTTHPALSHLLLSQIDELGRPRGDGQLYAYEIYDLELAAEMVVLSACQTALGREIPGEGLVGLTHGFLYAGAARVVVSLWEVNDRATAELMGHFYRHLLVDEMPPAAALRAAQDSIRQEKRWRAPYYWAGFVLQGEWRDLRRPAGGKI